ncbi:MAG: hypothetical protein IT559_03135 [Alphaproteobacteria bacterium]|nr:hypothetical protein [Alphaproteobacteria bacterium]
MKQHDITKICADSLRAFTNDNYGIKLKPSHAHELVAAYLGYKSKAALLADTTAPISNLRQALYIVLAPTAPIDQRREELEELSSKLPDTYILSEGVYAGLISEKWLLRKPWPTYDMLAIALADEYLREQKMDYIHYKPTGEGVKIEDSHDSVLLTVTRFYQIPTYDGPPTHNTYLTTVIRLPRVAAHIGYGMPDISSTIEKRKIGEDWP